MPISSQASLSAGTPRETQVKSLVAKGGSMTSAEQRTALIALAMEVLERLARLEAKLGL